MQREVKSFGDLWSIIKRRRWAIVVPSLTIFIIAALLAILLPRTFRSTSTILIEEQEIPREYVTTTVTSFAEERLQTINQRVMSSTKLLEIINKFNLYADLKDKLTVEEIVDKMRKNIKLETISANIIDRRTGQPTSATIAFSLAYQGKDPAMVQQIDNVLASLFLEENLRVRNQQTTGASKFLEDELKTVQTRLTQLDAQLAAYKQRNLDSLPELSQSNQQEVDRVDRDIDQLNDRLRTLKEQEGYLQAQLASIPTDNANSDKTHLQDLRVRLVELKSRYSDEYPDVKKTKSDIATLEKQLKATNRDTIAKPDSPAYVTLSSQLASTQSEMESVKRQVSMMQKKLSSYRGRIAATPRVEEGYKAIFTERNNTQAKYDDLMKKVMEARVAHGMEKEQMGERFTLIDAAKLPEKPVSPNIPAILVIGLILGIGVGGGLTAFQEHSDQSIITYEDLVRVSGLPVLASIPEIVNKEDLAAQRRKWTTAAAGVFATCLVLVASFHFFVMDLDIFWAKLMRRMGV